MRDIIIETIPGRDVIFNGGMTLIGRGKCGYDSVWRRRHRFSCAYAALSALGR